ncbi:MAG: hypothetical protein CM15mP106_5750 [Candidatus Neomarinimicrobiota bacterium]|nr:MAG: hypothetical protein CM15mP106_5750 [Candidatus Neomarinimicrobiota bacterium]
MKCMVNLNQPRIHDDFRNKKNGVKIIEHLIDRLKS